MNKLEIRHHQHYAFNANGKLVYIGFVKEKGEIFTCPYCEGRMKALRGEHNKWTFEHLGSPCEYSNYLHTLAEIRIRDWFNDDAQPKILYIDEPVTKSKCCDFKSCNKVYKGVNCIINTQGRTIRKGFDLRNFYFDAKREVLFTINGQTFKADILCKCKKKKQDPLFIEICVTHPCTEEKKTSGLKIIELQIKSEQDIDNIISGKTPIDNVSEKLNGFKTVPRTDEQPLEIKLKRFVLFKDDEWKIYPDTCKRTCPPGTGVEIVYKGNYINLKAVMAKLVSLGMSPKQRLLCRYYGENHGGGCVYV